MLCKLVTKLLQNQVWLTKRHLDVPAKLIQDKHGTSQAFSLETGQYKE